MRRVLTARGKNGRVYHYSRIPLPNGRTFRVRLSDDRETAEREAAELLEKLRLQEFPERLRLGRRVREIDAEYLMSMDACIQSLVRSARSRSFKRARPCDINLVWARETLVAQDYRCVVSGIRFSLALHGASRFDRAFAPSLDRIDCSGGYTTGNTRIVCRILNLAASSWGIAAVLTLAQALCETDRERGLKITAIMPENHEAIGQSSQ